VIREAFSSRNVMVLTITQTLFMFTVFLWWPYWSLFILELGATKELLGMLQMIETVTQLVCQLPGGILADRFGRRRLIVYSSIFRVASPIIYLFSTHWTHIAPGLFLGSLSMLGLPAMNALIAESLPLISRGAGISAYRAVTWMPMIITGLLGGVIMDTYGVVQGVKFCVAATLIVSILSVLLRWRFITETLEMTQVKEDERKKEASQKDSILQQMRTMPREIWIVTVVAALSGFAIRIVMSFMVVYAVEVVGLTNTEWGIIGTAVSLISTVLTIPAGILADRIGRKPCITVSRILSPISILGFTFAGNFWHMFSVRVIGGVARAGIRVPTHHNPDLITSLGLNNPWKVYIAIRIKTLRGKRRCPPLIVDGDIVGNDLHHGSCAILVIIGILVIRNAAAIDVVECGGQNGCLYGLIPIRGIRMPCIQEGCQSSHRRRCIAGAAAHHPYPGA